MSVSGPQRRLHLGTTSGNHVDICKWVLHPALTCSCTSGSHDPTYSEQLLAKLFCTSPLMVHKKTPLSHTAQWDINTSVESEVNTFDPLGWENMYKECFTSENWLFGKAGQFYWRNSLVAFNIPWANLQRHFPKLFLHGPFPMNVLGRMALHRAA